MLLLDGNNIHQRAAAMVDNEAFMAGGAGVSTGLLWQMVAKRRRIMAEQYGYPDALVVFTFDGGKPLPFEQSPSVDRWGMDAEYKANRHTDDPEKLALDREKAAWREAWRAEAESRGEVVVSYPGTEADDILAYMSAGISDGTGREVKSVIVTMDKDLMQCVDDARNVGMLRYRYRHGEVLLDEQGVEQEKGVPASRIRLQLALQGDKADNYRKIPGYGGKRGLALLNEVSTLDDLISALPDAEEQLRFNWALAGVGRDYMPDGAATAADYAVGRILSRLGG